MVELFQMWALVELLGIACLPLTITVFHNLPDRGWAFSKALGIALFAFGVWFPLICIRALPFSQLFILGVGLIFLACSLLSWLRMRQELAKIVRHNLSYIVVAEVVFLGMVFLLGFLRSFGPNIQSYEMFMDEGFIAAIMRSPHLPPNDMWFSGYSLNYYYYAHFTIAMLAKLLGQSPSIAFNTGISIFYGLTGVSLFGVTCNIVAWARHVRREKRASRDAESAVPTSAFPALLPAVPFGLLSMAMGLIFGNLAATQQWWQEHGNVASFNWFNPSRVIPNTINEFPAFSFLLSCFHAHVLALAFTIVGIALAFNLFLEKDGRGLFAFGRGWRLPWTLGMTALVLGGLYAMNGWDFPTYAALAVVCIALQQWLAYQRRFQLDLLLDIFIAVVSLVALSVLLFLPFYLNFSSPAQGIGLLPANMRSSIGDELLIYGLFAFVFLSLLLSGVLKRPLFESIPQLAGLSVGTAFAQRGAGLSDEKVEISDLTANGDEVEQKKPQAVSTEKQAQSATQEEEAPLTEQPHAVEQESNDDEEPLPAPSTADESSEDSMSLSSFARLLLAVIYLIACMIVLRFVPNSATFVVGSCLAVLAVVVLFYNIADRSLAFILLLGGTAFALVAVCEVIFLKDAFAGGDAERMNTVFKFYFQAWALLSVASGAAIFFILDSLRLVAVASLAVRWSQRTVLVLWSVFLLVLILASSVYPIVAPYNRFATFNPLTQKVSLERTNSLDGLTYLQADPASAGDYAAIRWLNANVQGDPVIVEAFGDDYSAYARISAFTGLPTLMGWAGHEVQWRLNWLNNPANVVEFNRRGNDIKLIYTDPNPTVVLSTMARYNAQYLYVGRLEQTKYPGVDLNRFSTFMQTVYNANGVTIYKVR